MTAAHLKTLQSVADCRRPVLFSEALLTVPSARRTYRGQNAQISSFAPLPTRLHADAASLAQRGYLAPMGEPEHPHYYELTARGERALAQHSAK